MKIGYLGPEGTLTEEAAQLFTTKLELSATILPVSGVPKLLEAIAEGTLDAAVVPAENSIEGSITATWDWLFFQKAVPISAELTLPVQHCLIGHRGQKTTNLKTVLSHPQALAQCRYYLRRNLPQAKEYETVSTAEAVRIVSVNRLPMAAIASARAAEIYGLDVLDTNIQDAEENYTRFVLLGAESGKYHSTNYKTTIVCGVEQDRPGSLLEILTAFAQRQINLTRIESRPARKNLGDYLFFIDLAGKVDQPEVAAALTDLTHKKSLLRNLGSYPVLS